jgi:hypothetical protein
MGLPQGGCQYRQTDKTMKTEPTPEQPEQGEDMLREYSLDYSKAHPKAQNKIQDPAKLRRLASTDPAGNSPGSTMNTAFHCSQIAPGRIIQTLSYR